jgi:hypothetical protein
MWKEAIMARLRYCFRIRLKELTNPTKTLRQMGFPRFQPETSDTNQAPDCSLKTHYTTASPLQIPSAQFLLLSQFQTITTQMLTDIT